MHALVPLDAAWPTLRGSGALAQALAATARTGDGPGGARAPAVRVTVAPGHVLAVGRQGSALVSLDAVPSTGWQLPESAAATLATVLTPAAAATDPLPPIPDALRALLISAAPGRIAGVYFQAAMNLRKPASLAAAPPATAGVGAGGGASTVPAVAPATAIPGPNSPLIAVNAGGAAPAPAPAAVAAPPDPGRGPFVWVVRETGVLEVWRLMRRKYTWTLLVRARLPTAAGSGDRTAPIAEVAFCPVAPGTSADTTMVLVLAEHRTAGKPGVPVADVWAQCVLVEQLGAGDQTVVQCSAPRAILRGVAPVALTVMDGGVALLPALARLATPTADPADAGEGGQPAREDVCYFWTAEGAIPSLWAAPTTGPPLGTQPTLLSVVWGRALTAGDGAPASAVARDPSLSAKRAHLVAYTTHPVTRELVLLDAAGLVTVCALADGALQLRPLVTLVGARIVPGIAVAVHRLHVVVADTTGLQYAAARAFARHHWPQC
jgi:hypothetical protein